MIVCTAHFLFGIVGYLATGTTNVADRSFLSELLALLLAATLGWPCAGYGSPDKQSETTSGRSETAVAGARVRARCCEYKAVPVRQLTTPRGVLDDDPAILDDDSEDGIEGSSAFVPPSTAELAHGCYPVAVPSARVIGGLAATHAASIDFLCRYQC